MTDCAGNARLNFMPPPPMKAISRSVQFAAWGLLGLVIAAICGAYVWTLLKPPPGLSQVHDFTLKNQLGRSVSLADLRGEVWVANIIFTRCPGPCAKMSKKMSELQAALPVNRVKLISLTADPEFDTPAVLLKYGERYHTNPSRWWFLTGDKAQIRSLAVESLKFVVVEKNAGERDADNDLFIHGTRIAVVDRRGQVRAWMDGDEPKANAEVLAAVEKLLREN